MPVARVVPGAPDVPAAPAASPGSTRSLPLAPLADDRARGSGAVQGLTRPQIEPFALVGVVWDDPEAQLDGQVQVRTRAVGSARWSGWREIEAHNQEHAPDPGSPERTARRLRGATAPLWVGRSDGVQVRVTPSGHGAPGSAAGAPADGRATALPRGLHLELVDPGGGTQATDRAQRSDGTGATDPADTLPARAVSPATRKNLPHAAPHPEIVTRKGWGADENLRESGFVYTGPVRAAFVHHTDTGNTYTCAEAPEVIRAIYRYHVVSEGWRDIGYNFLVDKCGTVYEGRAGGVDKPVKGAHTMGFNNDSTGVAVLGTFMDDDPPQAAVDALTKLIAWKLGLTDADPEGRTSLTSEGGNRYPKGEQADLNVVSGHRDGFATDCPGTRLYGRLGAIRSAAARLQGR